MKQWAVNVIYCLMTMILFQYVTPEGKYEKQVKTACGVLFIAAVIYPAASLLRTAGDGDVFMRNALYVDQIRYAQTYERSLGTWGDSLADIYESDLSGALERELRRGAGFEGHVSVTVERSLDSPGFGEVTGVWVTGADPAKAEQLKNMISGFYSLSGENIHITEPGGAEP